MKIISLQEKNTWMTFLYATEPWHSKSRGIQIEMK